MKLLSRIVSVIQTGHSKSLTITIPADFAREMNLKKGDKLTMKFNEKNCSLTIK